MTPEARRDRAAILRRDGVAPASGRVLAAFRFFALPAAFACAFLGLSPSWGEVGGEISLENSFSGTFHRHVYGPMRMPFKHRSLSVHRDADHSRLPRPSILPRFRTDEVSRNLSRTPLRIQLFDSRINESFLCLVQELDIAVAQLAVLFVIPKPPRVEILEQTKRRIRVPEPLKHLTEKSIGSLEAGIAGSDVIEAELRQLGKKCQISVQVGSEAVHALKSRIDETEHDHRRGRHAWVVKHRKLIHEIALREVALDSPGIPLAGKDFLIDPHLLTEKGELLLLSFEIREVLVSQNEVEGNKPRSDVFSRMDAPEADVLSADGFVQIAREKVKDTTMPEVFLGAGVLLVEDLLGEGHAALAGLRLDELQELLTGEVPGMRRHKVEETCFFLGIAKAAEGVRMYG